MSLRPGNIGSIELNGKAVGGLTSETYNPFSPLEASTTTNSVVVALGGTYSAASTQSDPEPLPLQ